MNKSVLYLFSIVTFVMPFFDSAKIYANQNSQKKTETWKLRKKKEYQQPTVISNEISLSDHITLENVAKATAVLAIGFATMGAGISATLQCFSIVNAPSIGAGALAGGAIGTTTGITTGATALIIKKCSESKQ